MNWSKRFTAVLNGKNSVSYPFINQTTFDVMNSTANASVMVVNNETNEQNVNQRNSSIDANPNANSTVLPNVSRKGKCFVGMTYIPEISEKLTKSIRRIAPNVVVAPRPMVKVGGIFTELKHKLTTAWYIGSRVRTVGSGTWGEHVVALRSRQNSPE